MVKKWIAALLAHMLLLGALAGCSGVPTSAASSGPAASVESESEMEPMPAPEPETEPMPAPEPETEPMPAPEPDNSWETGSPEDHGMDGALLQNMHDALDSQTGIYASVVIKDGVLVDEYYRQGYDENSELTMNSVSKSLTGALIGIAIDEGYIDGLDTSIAAYFPQVAGTDKEAVTIRHLLTMTSGIQWYEWGGNATSFWNYRNAENWVENILEQPMAAAPGQQFTYSTGNVHLLSAILQQATGKTQAEYAMEHLFGPMGIESADWVVDPQGIIDGGNGLTITARDAAKFGQLYLDGGKWKDRQLVPQSWVEESSRQQSQGVEDRSGGAYGYLFWMRPFGANGYDTYYAMGHAGQYILITPELNLVAVFASPPEQSTYLPWSYFSDYIVDACR